MRAVKKLLIGLIVIVIYIGSVFWGGKVRAQEGNNGGKIEYALAYPGILPDSPIYFLKVARDKFMLWAIRDVHQKAFYLILLSDKRLVAGEALISKSNKSSDIGVMAVIEGEQYFSQAVDQAIAVKKAGADTNDLFSKLTVSSAKHTEVINNLLNKISGRDAEQLVKARRDNQNSRERVREVFLQAMGF